MWLLSYWTIPSSMIVCTVKAFVGPVGELWSVFCFLSILSVSFASFFHIFTSFVLPSIVLLFGGTLCWDVTSSSTFRTVG